MRLFFILVASVDSVLNFRVRLEDVHCGSNEVIFSQVQKWVSKEKCQRKTENSILTGLRQ